MLHSYSQAGHHAPMAFDRTPSSVPLPQQYSVGTMEEDPPYRPCPAYYSQAHLTTTTVPATVPVAVPVASGGIGTQGLVLALNPTHIPIDSSASQPAQIKKRWWLWAIAFIDIILAVYFAGNLAYGMVTKGREAGKEAAVDDPIIMIWLLFIAFASFTIHFTMGLGLLAGLNSPDHASAIWYCQAWTYGAYFHFGEFGIKFLTLLVGTNKTSEVIWILIVIACRLSFRIVSFIMVKRYMYELSVKEQERVSAERRFFQLCQQQGMQDPLQLQLATSPNYPGPRSSLSS